MTTIRPFHPIWPQIPINDQTWRRAVGVRQLHIEIGAGVGRHAIQFAQQHPKDYLVAIERTLEKSAKMLQRISQHDRLPNLYALRADAIQWIWQNIQQSEVQH